MNVLSLFDGISCGMIALERAGIKVDKYYASEINENSIKISKRNYPNIIQLGDVRNWDKWDIEWKDIDLVIGGSPCFDKETLVLTNNGYKRICDIVVGDEVLTHKNRYRKVLNIGSKIAKTYNLRIQGCVDTIVTENHPYFARKKSKEYYTTTNGNKSSKTILCDTEWIEAGRLRDEGYRVCLPIPTIEENLLNITEEEAFVIGRYIADGHTRKDLRFDGSHNGARYWQVILSIGKDKVEKFKSNIHYSIYKHTDGCFRAVFSSKRLVEIVEEHCGCGAENKFFSETLINLPTNILKIMLDGYLSGDAWFDEKRKSFFMSTISKRLAISLQRVIAKVYGKAIRCCFHKVTPKKMIEGRIINQKDYFIIGFSTKEYCRYSNKENDYLWVNVKSLDFMDVRQVYNIEVEEDNSYTANNIVVHNCQNVSSSGNRMGLDGDKSSLYYYYRFILNMIKKFNPNVKFLLENVKMKSEYRDKISEDLGVKPMAINSALVSAQNRTRLYWFNWDCDYPEDKNICVESILETKGVVRERYRVKPGVQIFDGPELTKSFCIQKRYYKGTPTFRKEYCGVQLPDNSFRPFTPIELERLQTLPDNYTAGLCNTRRGELIGDGWTVDAVAHIFKHLKLE